MKIYDHTINYITGSSHGLYNDYISYFEKDIENLRRNAGKSVYHEHRMLKKRLDRFIKKYGFPTETRLQGSSIIIHSLDKTVIVCWYQTEKKMTTFNMATLYKGLYHVESFEELTYKLIKNQIL